MTDTDGLLILWNDNEFAGLLKKQLGDGSVVTSLKELREAIPGKKYLVVLTELNWDGKKLGDLSGVTIASRVLRAELKLRLPILFVSFLSYKQVRLDKQGTEILDRRIVGAVGHDYLRLPSTPEQWIAKLDEMRPLTEIQFADVFNSFCGVKGLIDDVIHQLGNRCRALFNSQATGAGRQMQGLVERAFDEIVSLLGETGDARAAKARVKAFAFEKANMDAILGFLNESARYFKSLIADDDNEEIGLTGNKTERLPWQVLILDDEPEALSPILAALSDRGIDYVIAQSVQEAESRIAEDRNNKITVSISDYRLLETFCDITRHQPRQGYDFLLELARSDRFIRLVALSGLSRRFLLESFRKYNTRVEVYSKNDLGSEDAIKLFADNLSDIGQEAYEAVCSQPSSAAEWKVLKPFYLAHRQAADYALEEQKLCDKARGIATQIDTLLRQGNEELLLNPQRWKFGDLQKRMSLRDLSGEERERKMGKLMPAFRNKLAARRLAIWLQIALGFDAERIFLALNGELLPDRVLDEIRADLRGKGQAKGEDWAESIESNAWAELKNRAKQPLTFLALTLSELPSGILAEERAWLNYDMGIDLTDSRNVDPVYYWFQVAAEDWCGQNADLAESLAETCDLISEKGVPAIGSWQDAKQFLFALRGLVGGHGEMGGFQSLLEKIQSGLSSEKDSPILLAEFQELVKQLSFS